MMTEAELRTRPNAAMSVDRHTSAMKSKLQRELSWMRSTSVSRPSRSSWGTATLSQRSTPLAHAARERDGLADHAHTSGTVP
jgi:hypothetical protein